MQNKQKRPFQKSKLELRFTFKVVCTGRYKRKHKKCHCKHFTFMPPVENNNLGKLIHAKFDLFAFFSEKCMDGLNV